MPATSQWRGRRKRPFSKSSNQAINDWADSSFSGRNVFGNFSTKRKALKNMCQTKAHQTLVPLLTFSASCEPGWQAAGWGSPAHRAQPCGTAPLHRQHSPAARWRARSSIWQEMELPDVPNKFPSLVSPVPAHRWAATPAEEDSQHAGRNVHKFWVETCLMVQVPSNDCLCFGWGLLN